jgi:hypothetical protein
MNNFSRDPIINVVHNSIKEGIRVAINNKCYGPVVVLILSGIDTMAYLNMPETQQDVQKKDFVDWSERYIKFPCNEQLTGLDLYGARCGMLHTYSVHSRLSRRGKCRQIVYADKSIPEVIYRPAKLKDVVGVSIEGLAKAFFEGIDKFMIELFSDKLKAKIAEERFKKIVHTLPYRDKKNN